MTPEEIDNLESGSEIDEEILVHVFNETKDKWHFLPSWSSDIQAAWFVVEAMKKKGVDVMLWSDAAGITCRFHTCERMAESCSASAPQSICRAALKFVFAEKERPCPT